MEYWNIIEREYLMILQRGYLIVIQRRYLIIIERKCQNTIQGIQISEHYEEEISVYYKKGNI